MAWNLRDFFFGPEQTTNEALDAFKGPAQKQEDYRKKHGEGIQDVSFLAAAFSQTTQSFNIFNKQFANNANTEVDKIRDYRESATYPEIAEVLEDAANESTQSDENGDIINIEIDDDDLSANNNAVKNITDAFYDFFHDKLNINTCIDDWMYSYYTDGRIYLENVIDINNKKEGIQKVKKLPAETMDFSYDPRLGETQFFVQYTTGNGSGNVMPSSFEEANADPTKYITFHPKQITYIDSGKYGRSRKDVLGYLDKVKQPYNQLKLLETSVIIYRIIRAPERFVFNIDVGKMPKDKAKKYVETVKQSMQKKVSYDPRTGSTTGEADVISMLDNFYIPKAEGGSGSTIDSIGGNAAGFKEIDDIYYFQRKLYRALKYPLSRITAKQERTEKESLFGGTASGEITQDEIKWGRFLKKNQDRFTDALLDLFLLHLDFTGLAAEYDLERSKISLKMTTPNNFLSSMWQKDHDVRLATFEKYWQYVESGLFSKYWLLKEIMKMNDDQIQDNCDGFVKDILLGFTKVDKPEDLPPGIQEKLGLSGDSAAEPKSDLFPAGDENAAPEPEAEEAPAEEAPAEAPPEPEA